MEPFGFGKNSGPSAGARAQVPAVRFPSPNDSAVTSGSGSFMIPSQTQSPPQIFQNKRYDNGQNPRGGMQQYVGQSPRGGMQQYVGQNPRGGMQQYVGQIPRAVMPQNSASSPVWGNQSNFSRPSTSPPAQLGSRAAAGLDGRYRSRPIVTTDQQDFPLQKRTRSPTFSPSVGAPLGNSSSTPYGHNRLAVDYSDLDAPEEMPSPPLAFESSFPSRQSPRQFAGTEGQSSSPVMWGNQLNPSRFIDALPTRESMFPPMTIRGPSQSRNDLQRKQPDEAPQKRSRSPSTPSPSFSTSNGLRRDTDPQSRVQSLNPGETKAIEVSDGTPVPFPAVKRTKVPRLPSPEPNLKADLDIADDSERELNAKAKRLARFKNELSQPVQSHPIAKIQKVSFKEKPKVSEDSAIDIAGDSTADFEGAVSHGTIVGLCQDMCPESERGERERKGDLDQYERLDGDRNLTNEFLAVKKYTRTAERDAELIRPMPILKKTMDYLLNLLDRPYDDRFLSLYNFLWDRMRAIRMDLRMQHIFDMEAISMLEQMIRLHVIAMHELCEYNKGEGFSEGFDAHLNIEQMNKTSVELFQLYDDHRKKGIHVPSEREFRGYYALLKLDKHPGYRVEPAELSLDLAKMTPEMRQTPEILFARDVARACRTGNFISFFRLARKASYLQACLMHAHFSKLRIQALASLHSGLQINQGIPVTHVARWLGMEEENMGDLSEYYGFSVKDYEEPYMVKENVYVNVDNDFPVKRSKLVEGKRSEAIAMDVSLPSLTELHVPKIVKEIHRKKDVESIASPRLSVPASKNAADDEMHDFVAISSPRVETPKPTGKPSIDSVMTKEKISRPEIDITPPTPFGWEFSISSAELHQNRVRSPQSPKYNPDFGNISFGGVVKNDFEDRAPTTPEPIEEISSGDSPYESAVYSTSSMIQPTYSEDLEDQELADETEEDISDAAASKYDEEVAEAKLKLILRIWKRRTTRKKELREQKLLAANAAMSLLSLCPPIWHYEDQSGNYSMLDIDHVMNERHEVEKSSWSVLNPSDVVASKLVVGKNPSAKCICWKMVLCSSDDTVMDDRVYVSNPNVWLHSKLMPFNKYGVNDLLVSSPGLAIWRSWVLDQSNEDLVCLSVIRSNAFENLNEAVTGAGAILFLVSQSIPIDIQKNKLHNLVLSVPRGSSLPLLICSSSSQDECDSSTVARDLCLHDIDDSRIATFSIVFLKDEEMKNSDGFFSSERLREGLEWLACESPPEIPVSSIRTRDLVQCHLDSVLDIPHEMDASKVGYDYCISAFNEALDRSINEVTDAAQANPTCWPCPEINLLEKSSEEYVATTWYLPSVGWSSPSTTEALTSALNDLKLPAFKDDLSWLYRGCSTISKNNIENQKTRLESCLVTYLAETSGIMGVALAQKEANVMVQKCTGLQLHNTTYYLRPQWLAIFQRIFNWRLAYLNRAEVSSAYVLVQSDPSNNLIAVEGSHLRSKDDAFMHPCLFQPSLDELIEVGCNTYEQRPDHIEGETDNRTYLRMESQGNGVPSSTSEIIELIDDRDELTKKHELLSCDDSMAEVKEANGEDAKDAVKPNRETSKIDELLKKCELMQNLIDKKLSIYF